MIEQKSQTAELPIYNCPHGHRVIYESWNYAKDFSDNEKDCDGRPMFESGLFCVVCDRAYGLGKLILQN